MSIFPSSEIMKIVDLAVFIYFMISMFGIISQSRRLLKLSLPLKTPFKYLPFYAIVPLVIAGLFVNLPIGNTAHLGGLIIGLAYGVYLKNKYKNKTELIRKYFYR
jgi:membrane associated rhomboid family serine protease